MARPCQDCAGVCDKRTDCLESVIERPGGVEVLSRLLGPFYGVIDVT